MFLSRSSFFVIHLFYIEIWTIFGGECNFIAKRFYSSNPWVLTVEMSFGSLFSAECCFWGKAILRWAQILKRKKTVVRGTNRKRFSSIVELHRPGLGFKHFFSKHSIFSFTVRILRFTLTDVRKYQLMRQHWSNFRLLLYLGVCVYAIQ